MLEQGKTNRCYIKGKEKGCLKDKVDSVLRWVEGGDILSQEIIICGILGSDWRVQVRF